MRDEEFVDVKMLDLIGCRSGSAGLTMHCELSNDPPDSWKAHFLQDWRVGGGITWPLPEFVHLQGGPCLVLRSSRGEAGAQDQLEHVQRRLRTTNDWYKQAVSNLQAQIVEEQAASAQQEQDDEAIRARLRKELGFG